MLASISRRLDHFDPATVTDAECQMLITALDADLKPAGVAMATRTIRTIMRTYPRGEVDDPDSYVAACAAVMSEYPADILARASDPRTGIFRHCRFLPSGPDLVEYLNSEMKRRAQLRDRAELAIKVHARERQKAVSSAEVRAAPNPETKHHARGIIADLASKRKM